MDTKQLKRKVLRVTKDALENGATVSEVAATLAPLIGRSRLYRWVEIWRKEGLL